MNCDCDSVDLCIPCCDTKTVTFDQCGALWPLSILTPSFTQPQGDDLDAFDESTGEPTSGKVVMVISCPSCLGTQRHEVEGTFTPGPPGKVTFELLPAVTCALPKGARMCDFRVVAISPTGARMTFITGRISVK